LTATQGPGLYAQRFNLFISGKIRENPLALPALLNLCCFYLTGVQFQRKSEAYFTGVA
jgi:hypothetical protein